MTIKAVLFDVDGTLVDSKDFHAEAWHRAIARFGEDVPVARIRAQIGKGGDNLLPALLPQAFVEANKEAMEAYRADLFARDYMPRIRPFPQVLALFERVRQAGMKIVLASSGKEDEVAHHLKLIECEDLVDESTSADDTERSKPSPDIFAAALGKLGDVRAEQAVVVGDSPYDMIAAGKIGLRRIGLLCGGFPADWLRESGAQQLFADPADLLERLDQSLLAREHA